MQIALYTVFIPYFMRKQLKKKTSLERNVIVSNEKKFTLAVHAVALWYFHANNYHRNISAFATKIVSLFEHSAYGLRSHGI